MNKTFELERVNLACGEHLRPAYVKVNPRARIPTLLVDSQPIRELSAILTWLGQLDGSLYPKAGTIDAAKCGEWLGWLTSTHHVTWAMILRAERFALDEGQHQALRHKGLQLLRPQFEEIEGALEGRKFLLGNTYCVCDPNIFIFYRWGWRAGFNMSALFPAWAAHSDRLLARVAVASVIEVEGIPALPQGPDTGFAVHAPSV